ncbi:MAG: hypothetical protein MUF25_29440 [Pirellulaceae bacterium]|nr:hypothetical protein [Pirellulaceae bacterium]
MAPSGGWRRSANPGDQVEVRQRGGAGSRSYQVIGLLTERNTLTLPGGEFRMGDTAGLRAWLAKIQEGGETRLQEAGQSSRRAPCAGRVQHPRPAVL